MRRLIKNDRDMEFKMVDFSLKGKIALVTGGSRGIGAAIASAFSAHGAHCVLVSRRIEGLQAVVKQIGEEGGSAEAIACHLGKLDQIDSLIQTIESNPFFGNMTDVDEAVWDKTLAVNLKGPFFLIKAAAKLMAKGEGGSIINVASINAVSPAPFQGVYSITKAALVSLTKAYALELAGFNIRVNALLPGLTKTKFAGALFDNKEIYNLALQISP